MIGLKQGTVELEEYQIEWVVIANQTIDKLNVLLIDYAIDIQHVGSTSIPSIKAKPIIDLVVGIEDMSKVKEIDEIVEREGMYKSSKHQIEGDVLYLIKDGDMVTHHIHIVEINQNRWEDYLGFRDYLIRHPAFASQYNKLKEELIYQHKNERNKYTRKKSDFICNVLELVKKQES